MRWRRVSTTSCYFCVMVRRAPGSTPRYSAAASYVCKRQGLQDEPTAGMTPDGTKRTTSLIRQLADTGDYTFLITEHDMDVVFGLADRILVMHRGENLFVGTPDEVKAHPEVRRAYLGEEEEGEASP